MEWTYRQLLHDLRGVALACDGALPRIRELVDPKDQILVNEVLTSILEDPLLKSDTNGAYNLIHKTLLIGAWQQNDDPEVATLCIAVLLAGVWHTNTGFGSPDQDWADFSVFIMNLTPPRRAAQYFSRPIRNCD